MLGDLMLAYQVGLVKNLENKKDKPKSIWFYLNIVFRKLAHKFSTYNWIIFLISRKFRLNSI